MSLSPEEKALAEAYMEALKKFSVAVAKTRKAYQAEQEAYTVLRKVKNEMLDHCKCGDPSLCERMYIP
jgi:pantothenate synthetase